MDNVKEYIAIDPDIRFGEPCIKGTRIAVSEVLSWFALGMTEDEILDDVYLSSEQIHAALTYGIV